MVDGDAGRRNSKIFGAYQPVLKGPVLTILRGDNLMDNDDVIKLFSVHLATLRCLPIQQHFQLFRLPNKTIATVTRRLLHMHSHHLCPFPSNAEVQQEKDGQIGTP